MNKLTYTLIAIVVFLVFIVAMAPASLLTTTFAGSIQKNLPELKIGATTGRLWQGSLQVQYNRFPPALITWDVAFLRLFTGKLNTSIDISGDGLQVELGATISPDGGLVEDVNGTIKSKFINAVSVAYGLDLAGDFTVSDVLVEFDQSWLTRLKGNVYWSGGIVHIETPVQFHSVKLPPMDGRLTLEDNEAKLFVSHQDSSLLVIALKQDGWSRTSVSYALMSMAGLPVPNGYQQSDGPAIALEEKIF